MARKAESYRKSLRNALRGDKAVEWEGVPAKVRHVQESGETYRPNGAREQARRKRQAEKRA